MQAPSMAIANPTDPLRIRFSRHAKRRMGLYSIEEEDVRKAIGGYLSHGALPIKARQEIVDRDASQKYGYPLKVVFLRENDIIMVVTAYPIKRAYKK
jgi:hypothetical protein